MSSNEEEREVDESYLQKRFTGQKNFQNDVGMLAMKYQNADLEDESDFSLSDMEEKYQDESDCILKGGCVSMAEETDGVSDNETDESDDDNPVSDEQDILQSDDANVSTEETSILCQKTLRPSSIYSLPKQTLDCIEECQRLIECCWEMIRTIEKNMENTYPLSLLHSKLTGKKDIMNSNQDFISALKSKLKLVLKSSANIADQAGSTKQNSQIQSDVSCLQEKWDVLHWKFKSQSKNVEKLAEAIEEDQKCIDEYDDILSSVEGQFDQLSAVPETLQLCRDQMRLLFTVKKGMKQLLAKHDDIKDSCNNIKSIIKTLQEVCDEKFFNKQHAKVENSFSTLEKLVSEKHKQLGRLSLVFTNMESEKDIKRVTRNSLSKSPEIYTSNSRELRSKKGSPKSYEPTYSYNTVTDCKRNIKNDFAKSPEQHPPHIDKENEELAKNYKASFDVNQELSNKVVTRGRSLENSAVICSSLPSKKETRSPLKSPRSKKSSCAYSVSCRTRSKSSSLDQQLNRSNLLTSTLEVSQPDQSKPYSTVFHSESDKETDISDIVNENTTMSEVLGAQPNLSKIRDESTLYYSTDESHSILINKSKVRKKRRKKLVCPPSKRPVLSRSDKFLRALEPSHLKLDHVASKDKTFELQRHDQKEKQFQKSSSNVTYTTNEISQVHQSKPFNILFPSDFDKETAIVNIVKENATINQVSGAESDFSKIIDESTRYYSTDEINFSDSLNNRSKSQVRRKKIKKITCPKVFK